MPLARFPVLVWRNYGASIIATLTDLLALTVVWGCLINVRRRIPLGVSVLVSLLAIMWMDSLIFITLAFGDSPGYWSTLKGTLVSRSVVALLATPVLTMYLAWEIKRHGWRFQSLPALAIFKLGELERELRTARHNLVKSTEELQRVEDRYEASVEDMPLMVCHFATDGQVVYGNKVFVECFSLEPGEITQVDFLSLVTESHRQELDGLLAGLDVHTPTATIEVPVMLGEDPQHWQRWFIRAFFQWDGRTSTFQAFGQDITQERFLEYQLRHGEKMRAVGQLAGGIAHDFNNILTAILGNAELALGSLEDVDSPDPFIREGLQQIEKSGRRAADLTRQLLMFSRRDQSSPEVLDLNQVLRGMEKMLPRVISEDIALKVDYAEKPATILADSSQLEQVIMNLAVNARDAMPGGGMLDLEARHVELDGLYAKTHPGAQPGPYVMLAVTDNGEGINPANMERLFEPFFTTKTKDKGTGLGLATVYGIVQGFGGHVRVYSEVGHGTTFKVYLPATESAESRRGEAAKDRPPGGNETLLVCEDEDSVRRLTVLQLRDAGYNVFEAENGEEALRQAAETEKTIDLLVTDVIMPQMGGQTLSRELSEAYPGLKTLFISGYTAQSVGRHGHLDENLLFIEKPFSRNALLSRVREILDSRA